MARELGAVEKVKANKYSKRNRLPFEIFLKVLQHYDKWGTVVALHTIFSFQLTIFQTQSSCRAFETV